MIGRPGYAARELERLLINEQTARKEERDATENRRHEALVLELSRKQVHARCDAADGLPENRIIPVLTLTQELLADPSTPCAQRSETWAVAIAEAIRRYDQAALTFAAAVRGRRPGAEFRWQEWSARVLEPPRIAKPRPHSAKRRTATEDTAATTHDTRLGSAHLVRDQEAQSAEHSSRAEVSDAVGDRVIQPDHGGFQHYIRKSITSEAISAQTAVSALCGWTWIPQRAKSQGDDLGDLPVCPDCKTVYESLPDA